ncbi:uncharacterized protein LOC121856019 [Homarus americanus]|nr:uncharacterized protein LOC121856019 [Homarus americanus]
MVCLLMAFITILLIRFNVVQVAAARPSITRSRVKVQDVSNLQLAIPPYAPPPAPAFPKDRDYSSVSSEDEHHYEDIRVYQDPDHMYYDLGDTANGSNCSSNYDTLNDYDNA